MEPDPSPTLKPWLQALGFTVAFLGLWLGINIAVSLLLRPVALLLNPDLLSALSDPERLTESLMTTGFLASTTAASQVLGVLALGGLLWLLPPRATDRHALTAQLAAHRPRLANLGLAALGGLTIGHLPGLAIEALASQLDAWGIDATSNLEILSSALVDTQSLAWPLMAFAVVVGAPVFEELAFRGAMWDRFHRVQPAGSLVALLGTSALFALYHADPLHIVGVLPIGLFLGLVRWRTGGLACCVVAHAANNGLAVVMALGLGTDFNLPLPAAVGAFVTAWLCLLPLRHRDRWAKHRQ